MPPAEELLSGLQTALQETDPNRQLDSIEIVTVRAYLARLGLDSDSAAPFPSTIAGWMEWVGHFSKNS